MGPVIRVVDLWKTYSKNGQENMAALRGTNLEIKPGEVVALYGKSGSGKTTLLNILAGIDRPSRGRVEVDGQDLEALGEEGRTQLRRQRIGFIFQFFNLLPTLTVFENVFLSLELSGEIVMITREDIRELAQFQVDDELGCALSFYFQPRTPQNKSHREEAILAVRPRAVMASST